MAGITVKWVGQDPGTWAEAFGRKAKAKLDVILEQVIKEAADDMVRIIVAAATPTGQARAAAGGNGPGRVDTGKMRDAVKQRITEKTKNTTTGEWGWLDEVDFYFIAQELGASEFNVRFAGMQALHGSYVKARENFQQKLKGL